jgi:hypothetical protein
MIQNKILQPKVSERHPIKTGADNYRIPTLYKGKKIAVVTNQSGVVLIKTTENLADNKMQTHFVVFLLAQKNQYPQNICTRTWFRGTLTEHIVDGMDSTTGLPLFRFMVVIKPTLGQLKGIDIMVLDYKMWELVLHLHLTTLYNGSLCRK